MYEASFGLSCAPFRSLPDPRFYLDEGQYGRLLSELIEGLDAGEQCLLLTGPPGSGKTAMVRRLMMMLDPGTSTAGMMFATAGASGADVLRAAMHAFDLDRPQTQPGLALDDWLSSQTAQGNRVLLIVDEAEHLGVEALRQLAERLAPASKTPGLRLCLVGQQAPAALAGAVRDGLLPAAGVHCRLRALEATETRHYVLHRLRCASWTGRPAFDRAATDAIHRRSAGIPRRIHRIADSLLQQLALEGEDVATAAAVDVADDGWTIESHGRAHFEAPPVYVGALARIGPSVDTWASGRGATVHRIASVAPTVPPPPSAPRWSVAGIGKAAAGGVLVGLAVIGNSWWPGVGSAVPPSGAQHTLEAHTARPMSAAPAGGVAQPAGPLSPAVDVARVSLAALAPGSMTADPGSVFYPTRSATPQGTAPPMVSGMAGSDVGGLRTASPPRLESGDPSYTRPGDDALAPPGVRRSLRRIADPVPADTMPAGEPPARTETAALPVAPPAPSCTGTAAVLGLCAATPSRPLPAPRSARVAEPAADALPSESLRLALPAAPCEPGRVALGLCER